MKRVKKTNIKISLIAILFNTVYKMYALKFQIHICKYLSSYVYLTGLL